MKPNVNKFMSQPNQYQPVNKYDLRRQLYQAIETQFQYVPGPLKHKIQSLSNDQLVQAIDEIPMKDSRDSVYELIKTMVDSNPPPMRGRRDHPKQWGSRPDFPSRPAPEESDSPDTSASPPRPVFSEVEPERNDNTSPLKAKSVEVIETKITDHSIADKSSVETTPPPVPLPSPPPVQQGADSPAPRKGIVIPIQLEESVINLETMLTAFANDQNQRGLQFQFQMGETEFISAQFIAQRGHIQSLESRVAKAVEGFFSEAQHILNQI
jgi:hypothetical protein